MSQPTGEISFVEAQSGGSVGSDSVSTSGSLAGISGDLYLAAISFKPDVEVSNVTGLGLNWTQVWAQCSGRHATGVAIWMALGVPSGSGPVTAFLSSTPSSAVIAVARYSGVDVLNPIGNVISGNTNGLGGACSDGIDSNNYSFGITTTTNYAMVFGAVAYRAKLHTPGAGYNEVIQDYSGTGGGTSSVTMVSQSIPLAGNVIVDGSFHRDVDWAVVALEINPGADE